MMSNDDIDMDMMMGGQSIPDPGDELARLGAPIVTVARTSNNILSSSAHSNGVPFDPSRRSVSLQPPALVETKSSATTRSAPVGDVSSSNLARPGAYIVNTRAVGSRPAWHRRISQRLGAHIAAPFRSPSRRGGGASGSQRRLQRQATRRGLRNQSSAVNMSSNIASTTNNDINNNRRAGANLPPELRVQMSNRNAGGSSSNGGTSATDEETNGDATPTDLRYQISELTTHPISEEASPEAECVAASSYNPNTEKEVEGDVRIGIAIILCVSSAVIAIFVGVFVALRSKPDDVMALPPTVSPPGDIGNNDDLVVVPTRVDILKARLEYLSTDSTVLEDTSSPQWLALNWLANADSAMIDDDDDLYRLEARYALATFYFSTTGGLWNDRMRFVTSDHECDWKSDTVPGNGVVCDENRAITGLTIDGRNNLRGPLPEEIRALSSTIKHVKITFQTNREGSVDAAIANPRVFSELTNLETLDLTGNQLDSTFPVAFQKLTNMQQLLLGDNSFYGSIPINLNKMTAMKRLHLQNNNLGGSFHRAIDTWRSLEEFDVSGNDKSGIDRFNHGLQGSRLLQNTNLRILSLAGVNLDVLGANGGEPIPESIGELTNLELLDLRDCGIDMTFPQYFARLTSLRSLLLDDNWLRGPISMPSLENMANLTVLSLRQNRLSGGIPEDIDSLSNLIQLDLGDNDLEGNIPSTIGNLSFLETFSLYRNDLNHVLPSTLGNMSSLRSLDLSLNDLSGTIPSELGSLENLELLNFAFNNFTGGIDFLCTGNSSLMINVHGDQDVSCSCCTVFR